MSTIPPISTKRKNHLSPQIREHRNTTTYEVENPVPGLGYAEQRGMIKSVHVISTLLRSVLFARHDMKQYF
jgi:hypothetical protein